LRFFHEAYLENIPNEKLSLVIGAQNGKVCRIIVVFVTLSQSFSFYRFYSTQSVNDDGTVSIQVGDKNAYFDHIACELHKVHQKYSDVNIVCQDGSTIVSNKAILCQSPEISALFHSQPDSWESKGTLYDFFKNPREIQIFLLAESWLVFPEVTSESMRLALDCFYSLNSRNSNKDLILEFEEIVFSNCENPIVNDDSFWEVVCKKDQFG